MLYDRDQDILYLAHQLWEEDMMPGQPAHAYWKQAATMVMARGRPLDRAQAREPRPGETSALGQRPARQIMQYGISPRIEMGPDAGAWRITLLGGLVPGDGALSSGPFNSVTRC